MAPLPRYEKIPECSDDDGEMPVVKRARRPWHRRLRTVIFAVLMATVTFAVGLGLGRSSPAPEIINNSLAAPVSHCGNSTEEARALGCTFDLLAFAWWPPACQDPENGRAFEEWLRSPARASPWLPLWYDHNGTRQVSSVEEASRAIGVNIYTTREYHAGHCAFWWRRLHLALEGNITTNLWRGQYSHTQHCTKYLLDAGEYDIAEVGSSVILGGAMFGWCM